MGESDKALKYLSMPGYPLKDNNIDKKLISSLVENSGEKTVLVPKSNISQIQSMIS